MTGWQRYRRTLWGVGVSLVTFIWCIAVAAGADNDRWLKDLHKGHQSPEFKQALSRLNEGRKGSKRLDECSACHGRRAWFSQLVSPMKKVADRSCKSCHSATQPVATRSGDSDSEEGEAQVREAVLVQMGKPAMGERLGRPSHMGQHFPGIHAGLPIPNGKLACADCHSDHLGTQLVDRDARAQRLAVHRDEPYRGASGVADPVTADRDGDKEIKRYRMTTACLGCHLPRTPSGEATDVLRDFAEAHQSGLGFDPPILDAPVDTVKKAAPGQPLDAGLQNRFVDAVLESLKKQENRRKWKNEGSRGCTPICHGEHTPATDDGTPEKYQGKKGAAANGGARSDLQQIAASLR